MTETVYTPPAEQEDSQEPLFGERQGAYGTSYTYGAQTIDQLPIAYETPEKPKPLAEMTADEMIEVALQDRLAQDPYGFFDPRRNAFISKYHWTPYRESEVSIAVGQDRFANPGLVTYLLGARDKGGMNAVRRVVNNVDKARSDITHEVELLREAQDVHSGQFNPDLIKAKPLTRQAMARAIYARSCLDRFEWPNHHLRKIKSPKVNSKVDAKLQAITGRLAGLPDEELVLLAERALGHQQARGKFLAEQYEQAREHYDTTELVAAARSNV
ncbi:MAG TPA: hypothetical protein VMT23_02870 [Candidatus Binatia bacterium]|nr:hypothetical protein [Candidatus Binatia bacterium]